MKPHENYEKYGDLFFKNGKPKKMYMVCYNREYLAELRQYNCNVYAGCSCAGLRCPYYTIRVGCKN